jgi:hypothetical protein
LCTDSYGLAFESIHRSPLSGRGFRTFLPEYRILDNQLPGTAVQLGLIALLALLAAIISAVRARRVLAVPGPDRARIEGALQPHHRAFDRDLTNNSGRAI